jgi:hypothetical protein
VLPSDIVFGIGSRLIVDPVIVLAVIELDGVIVIVLVDCGNP